MAYQGPMPKADRTRLEKAWQDYRAALANVPSRRGELRHEIRAAIDAGHSPSAIARLFGVTRQALYNLLNS